MGPLEVWVGWTIFFTLLTLSAALGISGHLRFGEAVTGGLLAIATGASSGGFVDAVRSGTTEPLRYAIPMCAIAAGGYAWLGIAIRGKRERLAGYERRPLVVGWLVMAAAAATTIIAVFAAKQIADRGAPIWVAPALTGVVTFAAGSLLVDRGRRRARAARALGSPPAAVGARTAIAVALGITTAAFFASLSGVALIALVALPFTLWFMWRAARAASPGGRALISVLVALDLFPICASVSYLASRSGTVVNFIGGAIVAVACAVAFWLSTRPPSARARRPA